MSFVHGTLDRDFSSEATVMITFETLRPYQRTSWNIRVSCYIHVVPERSGSN